MRMDSGICFVNKPFRLTLMSRWTVKVTWPTTRFSDWPMNSGILAAERFVRSSWTQKTLDRTFQAPSIGAKHNDIRAVEVYLINFQKLLEVGDISVRVQLVSAVGPNLNRNLCFRVLPSPKFVGRRVKCTRATLIGLKQIGEKRRI